jgi:hypothetical protein
VGFVESTVNQVISKRIGKEAANAMNTPRSIFTAADPNKGA